MVNVVLFIHFHLFHNFTTMESEEENWVKLLKSSRQKLWLLQIIPESVVIMSKFWTDRSEQRQWQWWLCHFPVPIDKCSEWDGLHYNYPRIQCSSTDCVTKRRDNIIRFWLIAQTYHMQYVSRQTTPFFLTVFAAKTHFNIKHSVCHLYKTSEVNGPLSYTGGENNLTWYADLSATSPQHRSCIKDYY